VKRPKEISSEEAKRIGESLYIDWDQVDLEQFRQGLMGKLVQGRTDPGTKPLYDGVLMTGKIVLNHMQEFPDYFTRLAQLEAEVDAHHEPGEDKKHARYSAHLDQNVGDKNEHSHLPARRRRNRLGGY
jgi:hypothetical protein